MSDERSYPVTVDASAELANRLASMPAMEAIRGPRDWATIQSALRAAASKPVAWRYKCQDGSEVLMLKRLTDEQKRRGYYTGEDGEDEVEGDEAVIGPFHWAEETPLYSAPQPVTVAQGAREAAIEECAKVAEGAFEVRKYNGRMVAAKIRALAISSTKSGGAA